MSGYALIHRSLVGHPAFRNDAEAMAFAYMVLRASWQDTRVRYKGRAVALRRGQLSMSQRDMAEALDRDKAWIERLWKRLKDEAMIEVAYEAGAAVITICNYDEYQANAETREAPRKAVRKADARQTQGTEQRRENREEENTPLPPAERGDAEIVLDAWNEMAARAGLSAIRVLSGDRKRHLAARLKEHGKDLMLEAVAAVELSPLCRGENDRNWKATFDFVLQPKSFAKLVEGAYGATAAGKAKAATPASDEEWNAYCDRAAERAAKMGNETLAAEWIGKKRSPRREASGPPRGVGALAARIVQQAAVH